MTAPVVERLRAEVGELVERHAHSAVRDFSTYRNTPVRFLREVLHCDPWSLQRRIARLVRKHPRVVVRSAHGMGKDWLMARLMLWHVYARGGLAIYTAPTDRQLEIGMREVRAAFRKAKDLAGELFARALRIQGDDRLMAFTSTNVDNLTGWHHPAGVMVCISEGQGERVEDVAYDAAFALATEEHSRIVVGGNPIRPMGRFYEICRKRSWKAVKIPASEHPNIKAGHRVVPYGPSPDWPAQIEEEYGIDSPFYIARVLAEFPAESDDALVRREWLDAAHARWKTHERVNAASLVIGVDPARLGPDSTALCVRQGMHVREFIQWRGHDTMASAERIAAEVRRLMGIVGAVAAVVVDEIGLGAGVLDRLRELLPKLLTDEAIRQPLQPPGVSPIRYAPRALGFDAGKAAGLSQRFVNQRAQAYWALRKMLENGEIALPPNALLDEELLHTRVQFKPDGRTAIESKDDIKARLGRSPDLADALVISLAPLLDIGGFRADFR